MLKEYLKNKVFGTQHEWESHIDNLIRIFIRNLKGYTPFGASHQQDFTFDWNPADVLHPDSTHVRGFTHRDSQKVFISYQAVRLMDRAASLMYPLPLFIAKHIDDYFTGLSGYVCYLFRKTC